METFTVYLFFPNGDWNMEGNGLSAEDAIKLAKRITQRPAVLLGIIARVIVTDADDYTVFDWRNGKGVVFPPQGGAQ